MTGEDSYSCDCTEEFEGETCESSKLASLRCTAVMCLVLSCQKYSSNRKGCVC